VDHGKTARLGRIEDVVGDVAVDVIQRQTQCSTEHRQLEPVLEVRFEGCARQPREVPEATGLGLRRRPRSAPMLAEDGNPAPGLWRSVTRRIFGLALPLDT